MRDAIVEEVRQVREAYARRFNHDLDAICAELRRLQQLDGAPVVSLPKRPAVGGSSELPALDRQAREKTPGAA